MAPKILDVELLKYLIANFDELFTTRPGYLRYYVRRGIICSFLWESTIEGHRFWDNKESNFYWEPDDRLRLSRIMLTGHIKEHGRTSVLAYLQQAHRQYSTVSSSYAPDAYLIQKPYS